MKRIRKGAVIERTVGRDDTKINVHENTERTKVIAFAVQLFFSPVCSVRRLHFPLALTKGTGSFFTLGP